MDIQFSTYILPSNTEHFLTEIDYSGISYLIELDEEEMIYRNKLNGSLIISGDDFDYFLEFKELGELTVIGKFYINGIIPFGNDWTNIEYKLDAKSWNFTDKIVELEIIALDNYAVYDTKENKKINILKYDIARRGLFAKKKRKKLYFYDTQVAQSSIWTPSMGGVYAREEIKNATDNEINSLNGVNGWLLTGTNLVRDWTISGDFRDPLPYPDDFSIFESWTDSPAINSQGYFNIYGGDYYNFINTYDFLNEYTVIKVYERYTNPEHELYYEIYALKNNVYYGSENDYKYSTVRNAMGLYDTLQKLHKEINSLANIPFVVCWYNTVQTLFNPDQNKNEQMYIQHLSEIVLALDKSQSVNGKQIEPATIGYMRLSDINKYLRDFWNVYWYKINENQIKYEHYTNIFSTFVPENDFTNTIFGNLTPLKIIEFNSEDRFNRIEFDVDADNIDFVGMDIDFEKVKNENIKVNKSGFFYTDVENILANDKYPENVQELKQLLGTVPVEDRSKSNVIHLQRNAQGGWVYDLEEGVMSINTYR